MSILIDNKHNFALPVSRRVAEREMYVRVCVQGKYPVKRILIHFLTTYFV